MKHASAVTYCDAQNYLNSHITPTKSHWHSFCNQTNIDFCLLLWSHSLISLQWINDFICICICMCDRILYLQIMKLIKHVGSNHTKFNHPSCKPHILALMVKFVFCICCYICGIILYSWIIRHVTKYHSSTLPSPIFGLRLIGPEGRICDSHIWFFAPDILGPASPDYPLYHWSCYVRRISCSIAPVSRFIRVLHLSGKPDMPVKPDIWYQHEATGKNICILENMTARVGGWQESEAGSTRQLSSWYMYTRCTLC